MLIRKALHSLQEFDTDVKVQDDSRLILLTVILINYNHADFIYYHRN